MTRVYGSGCRRPIGVHTQKMSERNERRIKSATEIEIASFAAFNEDVVIV